MSKAFSGLGNTISISLKKFFSLKTRILLILLLFILHVFLMPLKQFSMQVDVEISPWVFPFLISEDFFSFIYLSATAYFFSDVPFMQHEEMYRLIRLGRKRWTLEKIGTIVLNGFEFVAIGVLLSIVILVPQLGIEKEWGRVLHTFALTDAGDIVESLFAIPYEILKRYSAIDFMIITIVVVGLVTTFIGLLMFAISLFLPRIFAICAAVIISIMPILVMNAPYLVRRNLAYLSPAFWIRVTQIGSKHIDIYFPGLQYVVVTLILLCLSLGVLIVWRVKTVDFQWIHEE